MDVIYRYDPYAPLAPRSFPTPEAARKELLSGNDRFAGIVRKMQERTLGQGTHAPIIIPVCPMSMGLPLYEGAMPNQAPFAVVLGCSDARVPTEAVFDQSFNDLFVLRIAGNVLGSECLGSLHFAVRNLGSQLQIVVVLGHSKCGAVTAAVDAYLSPDDFSDIAFTFSLRSLVDQIQIAVRGAARAIEKRAGADFTSNPEYRSVLVTVAVFVNAAISALELRRELDRIGGKTPEVMFGVYDFSTLSVQSHPVAAGDKRPARLQAGPRNAEELSAYTAAVVDQLFSLNPDAMLDLCRMTVKV
jgi:carbonic anhydrase